MLSSIFYSRVKHFQIPWLRVTVPITKVSQSPSESAKPNQVLYINFITSIFNFPTF